MQQRQQKHQQKAIFYFRAHENECASAIMEQRGTDRYYHCLFAGVSSDDRIPSLQQAFCFPPPKSSKCRSNRRRKKKRGSADSFISSPAIWYPSVRPPETWREGMVSQLTIALVPSPCRLPVASWQPLGHYSCCLCRCRPDRCAMCVYVRARLCLCVPNELCCLSICLAGPFVSQSVICSFPSQLIHSSERIPISSSSVAFLPAYTTH
jgi:hypothetical protein